MAGPKSIRAVVRAGAVDTWYACAGSGAPVVVLGPPGTCVPVRDELLRVLSPAFRVYVPEVPEPGLARVSDWFDGFLNGLGLGPAGLVVAGGHDEAALTYARAHPWQIARVVVLSRAPSRRRGMEAALPYRLAGASQPVMVLPGSCRALPVLRLLRFLAGEVDPR